MGAQCAVCSEPGDDIPPKRNTQKRVQYKTMHSDDFIDGVLPNTVQTTDEIVDAFKTAAKSMDEDLVMHLDQRFPDMNMLDMLLRGDSLLHKAVQEKKSKLIVYCLENGLNPNMRNAKDGDTPLHIACKTRDVRIVAVLLRYKADSSITNNKKKKPLDIAVANDDGDLIELLSKQSMDAFRTFSHNGTFRDSIGGLNQTDDDAKDIPDTKSDTFEFMQTASNRSATAELMALNEKSFPEMKTWLEKKSGSVPYSWHKRWVIVKESFLLWSEIEVECGDPKDKAERIKFKHISLLQVDAVEKVEETKFKVMTSIGDKTKSYLWKANSEDERDRWARDLDERIQHAKNVVDFLSEEVADIY